MAACSHRTETPLCSMHPGSRQSRLSWAAPHSCVLGWWHSTRVRGLGFMDLTLKEIWWRASVLKVSGRCLRVTLLKSRALRV